MTAQRYHGETAGVCRMVEAWYSVSRNSDSAVITLPDAPAIYLTHQPHEQWSTGREVNVSLHTADFAWAHG